MDVNFYHLRILLIKNLRLQIRSPGWLIMQILFPLLAIGYGLVLPLGGIKLGTSVESFYIPNYITVLWSMENNCCNTSEVKRWMDDMNYDEMNNERRWNLNETTIKEMRKQMMKHVKRFFFETGRDEKKYIGLIIEEMDVEKKKLKYKILAGQGYLSSSLHFGLGPFLHLYTDADAYYAHALQYRIETSFQKYVKKNKTSHGGSLMPLPRPENIMLSLRHIFYYGYCTAATTLLILYTVRNIVSERETIKPYLSVMGLSTTTFYLSHCIIGFIMILIFSHIHLVAYFLLTVDNFPWSLAVVTMILYSFTTTAYAVMLASLFTSSSTAIQLTLCFWLAMCATPVFVLPDSWSSTALASLQSLLPSYALHYIFKYLFAASDYEIEPWRELFDSRWSGQAAIWPLMVLALSPILLVGIAYIFENKLWRKIGRIFGKKIQDDEESQKGIKLAEADEKFEVDEKDADIILKDVYKKYPSGVKAVNGLDMMALRGQVTVLLGHNGAGKTTTFSMICGVEEATAGTVEVGGYPAGSLESRQTIGYCAQVNTLIEKMTVQDHLWLAHGLKRAEGDLEDEAEKLMDILKLDNVKVKYLSGGQKRKLCVAMALIGDSQVVLLDEPTAGMDPESRRDVEKMLAEAKKERTILLTTHYMDEAETLGDSIFIMADGHGICSGSPQFLKKRFGTGYVLTLVAGEGSTGPELAKQVEPLVQKYTPGAKLGEIRGKQVELAVPIDQQSHFPQLFEHIETNQKNLHISSFGLSLNSLEQVFLNICNLTDKDKSKRDVPLEDTLAELYEERKREGLALYFQQFLAVFIKKSIYILGFWSQLVIQIGLPLLILIGTLAMYTFTEPGQTDMVVRRPPGNQMFMQYNAETKEVYQFKKLGPHTVPVGLDMHEYVRYNLDKNLRLGIIFDEPMTLVVYNSLYPLAAAEAINTLSWIRSPDFDISLSVDVFENWTKTGFTNTFLKSLLLLFLITITVCQLVVVMIEDRASRFAHQQLLTGMKPTIYWLGEVVYCLLIYSFQAAVYSYCGTLTGIITLEAGVNLFLILLLYFWATISTVFAFSRFMNSSSKGALLLWLLLYGSPILVNLFSLTLAQFSTPMNTSEGNLGQMTVADYVFIILRLLFPSYTLASLISDYVNYSNGGYIQGSSDPEALIALHCICLATSGAVGLILFILLQQRPIRYGIFLACKGRRAREWIPNEAMKPEDSIRNAPEGQAMLEVTDVSKVLRYKCVLAHLSMSVRKNEIFGLLGVSGAGKTTAFNILTGQMFATEGTATIDGVNCTKKVLLGFCPQFDSIHPALSAREALTLLARIHGYTDPKQTADRLLEIVKMTEHGKKRMGRCSGGQKRRISVAASLLTTKSPMIILDEATAGIDPKARRDIWEVITAARNHAAVLMTSHSMDECEALCNRIGILKQGGLAIVGTSQSLKSRYGNFYTLTMALPSSDMKAKVLQEVAVKFPGSILKSDGFSLHLKWQVPKKPTDRWSTVFASCLELSERIGVADFCLTQSTLQDIFLLLAGHNAVPMKAGSIQQPSSQSRPATPATRATSAEPTSRSKNSAPKSAEKSDVQENQQSANE